MKRLGFALGTLALLVATHASPLAAGDPFDKKLSKDKQAVHALNRLTFGARPGDVQQVRKTGVEKWIHQQLHPELIPQNALLAERLKPFETLQLATWQLFEKYQQPTPALVIPPRPALTQALSIEQIQRLTNGTAEERLAVIMTIPADRLPTFLPSFTPAMLQDLPALAEQAAKLRQADNDVRMRELQRVNPPLNQLLTAEQRRITQQGTPKEKRDLLMSFDRTSDVRSCGNCRHRPSPTFRSCGAKRLRCVSRNSSSTRSSSRASCSGLSTRRASSKKCSSTSG